MFELEMEGESFSKIVKAVYALTDEARVHINRKKGIAIVARDPTNVSMVVVMVGKKDMYRLKVSDDEVVVGLDLKSINKFSKNFKNGIVKLSYDVERSEINIAYSEPDKSTIKFTTAVLDPSSIKKPPKVPDLKDKLTANVSMTGEDFRRVVLLSEKLSDEVLLRVKDEEFQAIAEGDIDKITVTYKKDDVLGISGEAESVYGIDYLKQLIKPINSGDIVNLRFGTDFPLNIEFGHVNYFLAPRIRED